MLRNKDSNCNFLCNTNYNRIENKEKFSSFPSSYNIIRELHKSQPYDNTVDFDQIDKANEVCTVPLLLRSSSKAHQHYTNYTTNNWNIQPSFNNSWSNCDENFICYHSHNESGDEDDVEIDNVMLPKVEQLESNGMTSINLEFLNHDNEYQRQQLNNTLQLTGQQFTLVSGLPTPTEANTVVRNVENAEGLPEYNLPETKQIRDGYSNNTCSVIEERGPSTDSFIDNQLAQCQKQSSVTPNTQVPKLLRPLDSTQNSNKFTPYENNAMGFSIESNDLFSGNTLVNISPPKENSSQWSLTSALDLYAYPAEMNNTASAALQKTKTQIKDNKRVSEDRHESECSTTPTFFICNDASSDSIVRQLLEDPYLSDIIEKPQKRGLYRCAHCPSTFGTIFEYASHLDEYRVERKYKCPFKKCAWRILGLPRRSDLRRHCAIQHKYELYKELKKDLNLSEDAYPSLVCPVLFCQKEFYRRDAFKRHLSIVHQNENSRFNKRLKKISEDCPLFATETERISYIKEKMSCKKPD